MPIFEINSDRITPLIETSFSAEGIYERKDIQRLLKADISVLSNDLMVIDEEFGDWEDSNRRVDLLCIDRDANIVVVEIKRTDDGGHMELQAIRYAAMLSTMTFKQLVEAHSKYLARHQQATEQAETMILSFLKWNAADEKSFAQDVKILLAAANFSKEITMSVLWLNQYKLDIRCIRLQPYKLADGRILLDVQQIIPLPEVSDFQTQIRAKEQAARDDRAERYDIRFKFWAALLEFAKTKTNLHATRSPGKYNWIGGSTGKVGLNLNYVTREFESQVELYIDCADEDKNLQIYKYFELHAAAINESFGGELVWEELPNARSCRVRHITAGGWKSPSETWPEIHNSMVDAMIRLDSAVRPYFSSIPN